MLLLRPSKLTRSVRILGRALEEQGAPPLAKLLRSSKLSRSVRTMMRGALEEQGTTPMIFRPPKRGLIATLKTWKRSPVATREKKKAGRF